MIYDVRHVTRIRYSAPVRLARFNLRLKPAPWPGQDLTSYALDVTPWPFQLQQEPGPFLVNRARVSLRDPLDDLTIESRFSVTVAPRPLPFAAAGSLAPQVGEVAGLVLGQFDVGPGAPASYLYPSPVAGWVPEIANWARGLVGPEMDVFTAATTLMTAIYQGFKYDTKATRSDTPPAEAFRTRRGVCQDFAHVMIVAARALAIPAGYVSGYLRTIAPPGQPRLVGADAMHAWVNVWCGPEAGWIGFDPTNNLLADEDHIFTAMGRDYGDVAPLDGVFHGDARQRMDVAVDVVPVDQPSAA